MKHVTIDFQLISLRPFFGQNVMSKCRNSSNSLFFSECHWMFALPSDGQLGRATCSTSDKTVCHNLNLPKCDIHFIDSVMKLPWYNALNVILYQDLSWLLTMSKWQLNSKVSSQDVQLQFLQDVFKIFWTLQLATTDKNLDKMWCSIYFNDFLKDYVIDKDQCKHVILFPLRMLNITHILQLLLRRYETL